MLSVIIPCYNCASYIPKHLSRLSRYLGTQFQEFEIVAVDDGSSDQTVESLRGYATTDSHVRIVALAHNQGKGAAVRAGILASRGEICIFTDADLPYDLAAMSIFAKALGEVDVVLGARQDNGEVNGQKIHRTTLSRVFVFLANLVLLRPVQDTQAGFKGFTKKAAQDIFKEITIPGFGFDVEAILLAQKKNLSIESLPVILVHQEPSTVRVARHGLQMCIDLIRIFWRHRIRA